MKYVVTGNIAELYLDEDEVYLGRSDTYDDKGNFTFYVSIRHFTLSGQYNCSQIFIVYTPTLDKIQHEDDGSLTVVPSLNTWRQLHEEGMSLIEARQKKPYQPQRV